MKFTYPTFYGVDEIEGYHRGHWFSKDTMRFFGTRLTSHFKRVAKNKYVFITTERNPSRTRKATLRIATVKQVRRGEPFFETVIETLGEFHSMTLPQAVREFEKLERFQL